MNATEMAATFRQAAAVIRTGGLIQGRYWHSGAHCAVGALMVAKGKLDVSSVQSEIIRLGELLGRPDPDAVTSWNDAPGRTANDVATLMEQAAEKLEADL